MADETPDFDFDPTGHLKNRLDRLETQNQFRDLMSNVRADEARFSEHNSDYYDALDTIRERETANLMANGLDEKSARDQHALHEVQAAAQALQRGQSPAEYVYNLAKSRYGYDARGDNTDTNAEFEAARADIIKGKF